MRTEDFLAEVPAGADAPRLIYAHWLEGAWQVSHPVRNGCADQSAREVGPACVGRRLLFLHLNPDRRPPGNLIVALQYADVVVVAVGLRRPVGPGGAEAGALGLQRGDHFAVAHDVDLGQVARAGDVDLEARRAADFHLVAHDRVAAAEIDD